LLHAGAAAFKICHFSRYTRQKFVIACIWQRLYPRFLTKIPLRDPHTRAAPHAAILHRRILTPRSGIFYSNLISRSASYYRESMKPVLFPSINQTHFVTLVVLLLFCECWIFYGHLRLQHDAEVVKVGQLNQEI
jgi:hypothetical protein